METEAPPLTTIEKTPSLWPKTNNQQEQVRNPTSNGCGINKTLTHQLVKPSSHIWYNAQATTVSCLSSVYAELSETSAMLEASTSTSMACSLLCSCIAAHLFCWCLLCQTEYGTLRASRLAFLRCLLSSNIIWMCSIFPRVARFSWLNRIRSPTINRNHQTFKFM